MSKPYSSVIWTLGIVGEGKMGASIFNYLIDFGFQMVWLVSETADQEKMMKQFSRRINRSVEAGIIGKETFDTLQQSVISADPAVLAGCQLIIEAIPENPDLKKKFFEELDTIVNQDCIFASNSSSVNPSRISPESGRRDKFVGLHFFYPVPLKNIVEFITAPVTSAQTVETVSGFLDKIRRSFLLLDEANSFVLNRLFLEIQNEAFSMVSGGICSYEQMDQIVRANLFPFGVFDFCDSVGNDTMLAAVRNYTVNYPNRDYYTLFTEKLESLCNEGRFGMKCNAGFYDYPVIAQELTLPENTDEIVDHLSFTFHHSAKRFTAQSQVPEGEMNDAIKEYFSIDHGPFE